MDEDERWAWIAAACINNANPHLMKALEFLAKSTRHKDECKAIADATLALVTTAEKLVQDVLKKMSERN